MTANHPKVTIYSDGACRGNPGIGSWAAILYYGEKTKELSGVSKYTTNNKMELQAAIEALKALKKPCLIEFFVDSEYVRQGITKWLAGWVKKGWKTAAKKPVKNKQQWQELDKLAQNHTINWHWVKGHSNDEKNNAVDKLANIAIDKYLVANHYDFR